MIFSCNIQFALLTRRILATAANKATDKDNNDLDAVAGNAEDDIGDLIANIREKELLYGDSSLLAAYGPLVAQICASPKAYKVGRVSTADDMCPDCPAVSGSATSSRPGIEQADVCQRAILRGSSASAFQHSQDVARPGHKK